MKRLTYRDKDGFPMMKKRGGFKQGGVERLASYEDTGRTPEEVTALGNLFNYALEESKTLTEQLALLNRLRELAEADKDGRLEVLPCKDWLDVVFGDQVLFWGIDKDYVEQPIREISVDDAERIGWYDGYKTVYLKGTDENGEAWEFYPEEIGKTVFLTREEAEKALEAKK
jgi:hypothetical protein